MNGFGFGTLCIKESGKHIYMDCAQKAIITKELEKEEKRP